MTSNDIWDNDKTKKTTTSYNNIENTMEEDDHVSIEQMLHLTRTPSVDEILDVTTTPVPSFSGSLSTNASQNDEEDANNDSSKNVIDDDASKKKNSDWNNHHSKDDDEGEGEEQQYVEHHDNLGVVYDEHTSTTNKVLINKEFDKETKNETAEDMNSPPFSSRNTGADLDHYSNLMQQFRTPERRPNNIDHRMESRSSSSSMLSPSSSSSDLLSATSSPAHTINNNNTIISTSSSLLLPPVEAEAANSYKYYSPPTEWDKALTMGRPPYTGQAVQFFTTNPPTTAATATITLTHTEEDEQKQHQQGPTGAHDNNAQSLISYSTSDQSLHGVPLRIDDDESDEKHMDTTNKSSSGPVKQQGRISGVLDSIQEETTATQPEKQSTQNYLTKITTATTGTITSRGTTTMDDNGKQQNAVVSLKGGPPLRNNSFSSASSVASSSAARAPPHAQQQQQQLANTSSMFGDTNSIGGGSSAHLSSGVLPDVFLSMRQRIESLTLFDSDMMKIAEIPHSRINPGDEEDPIVAESRESLKRSSQQSISAAVLVSLAHKRYERRRLAAMEIEKVVRSLVQQNEFDRIRAILLLLSDDYVRSTSEDARKGGVVALAACAIGLKKAADHIDPLVQECRDLILASVVHACQDFSQRVRYYATESLFNVVKVVPALVVHHFFILFEILRSLYADVDPDVRSGADLLDKKLKEIIVSAMNVGHFTTDSCVPVFARFVYVRNKATKRLTLTWLQELNEKLIGAPILEFLHLFLGGIFDMVADPTIAIRQSALAFLQSVLPKLLVINSEAIDDMDDQGMKVDFDKILQSLVTTMEHADPFVRKVAMYWMCRIVKAHIMTPSTDIMDVKPIGGDAAPLSMQSSSTLPPSASSKQAQGLNAAYISVRNSVPHVLPGILLSIGDSFTSGSGTTKDTFLPDQTTRALAEQTNAYLQDAVRRDGRAYVPHLDGFIVALREELDAPGGLSAKNPPAQERKAFRTDVKADGTGIEAPGWFRSNIDSKDRKDESSSLAKLCALQWIAVLYESVVPIVLKADFAREFILAIIHQLLDDPPSAIVEKSLEVLAKITIPVDREESTSISSSSNSMGGLGTPPWASQSAPRGADVTPNFPMTNNEVSFALEILDAEHRRLTSRDRQVFSALIQLHAFNELLLTNFSGVLTLMCRLQPPEFVFVSFSVELDRFVEQRKGTMDKTIPKINVHGETSSSFSRDLRFASSLVQHMNHVLLNSPEARPIRTALKDCIVSKANTEPDRRRSRLFHILLHSFSHNIAATISLCLWSGAYRTASLYLHRIDPLDIDLTFLLEMDRLIETLERPLFRHLHVRMLEGDVDSKSEGSGAMLFQLLKSLLMILPQSTCYSVLKGRLVSVSRFRQSAITVRPNSTNGNSKFSGVSQLRKGVSETDIFVSRIELVRRMHSAATWQTIRADSLELPRITLDSAQQVVSGYGDRGEEVQPSRNHLFESDNLTPTDASRIDTNNQTNGNSMLPLPSNEWVVGATHGSAIETRWKSYWTER